MQTMRRPTPVPPCLGRGRIKFQVFWSGYALEIKFKIKKKTLALQSKKILKIIFKIISSEATREKVIVSVNVIV